MLMQIELLLTCDELLQATGRSVNSLQLSYLLATLTIFASVACVCRCTLCRFMVCMRLNFLGMFCRFYRIVFTSMFASRHSVSC